jgi:hypothetical protein
LHLGRSYDELALNGNTLNAKRATARSILGEPIGLSVRLELDPSAIVAPDGSFNPDIIPAYVQAFSDPQQLATDLRWAVTKHAIVGTVVGAALALTLYLLELWRRRRQRGQLRRLAPPYRLPVVEIRARERVNRRRAGMSVAVALTLAFVPSADRHVTAPRTLRPDPILADTRFAGTQIGGCSGRL